MPHELDRLLSAEHVDRGFLLQIADQSEVLLQDLVRRWIRFRIDDEDAKP
jgi:hypothetical protein